MRSGCTSARVLPFGKRYLGFPGGSSCARGAREAEPTEHHVQLDLGYVGTGHGSCAATHQQVVQAGASKTPPQPPRWASSASRYFTRGRTSSPCLTQYGPAQPLQHGDVEIGQPQPVVGPVCSWRATYCTACSGNSAATCMGLACASAASFSSCSKVFGESRTRRCSLHVGSVARPPPAGTRNRAATSLQPLVEAR